MKIPLLCKLGIHRPLKEYKSSFTDSVTGKTVFSAKCPCGREWLTDSPSKWVGFKCVRQPEALKTFAKRVNKLMQDGKSWK